MINPELGFHREFKPADEDAGEAFDAQGSRYLTAKDTAEAASLPIHIFQDRAERERKQIPHLMLVGNLRFSLQAILGWEMANSVIGRAACAGQTLVRTGQGAGQRTVQFRAVA